VASVIEGADEVGSALVATLVCDVATPDEVPPLA
jgi:hypothetical protein